MASNYNRKSNTSASRKNSSTRSRSAYSTQATRRQPSARSKSSISRTGGSGIGSSRDTARYRGADRNMQSAQPRNSSRTSQRSPQLRSVRIGDIDQAGRDHRVQSSYRRHVVRISIVIAIIIVLLVTGIAVYNSSLFTITNVTVKNVEHLTAEEMTELASVPSGTTLLRVDEAGIKARLAEEAWVKEVQVNRVFPDTLELVITERTIAAVVEVPIGDAQTNENWAIASDGMWLMNIPRQDSQEAQSISAQVYEDAASVLKITGVPYGVAPEVGSYCSDDNVNNALAIVSGLSTELADQVSSVIASGVETTTFILDNGIEIAFGSAEDIRDKERVCLKLMEEYPDQITYINVRVVEKPTYRTV